MYSNCPGILYVLILGVRTVSRFLRVFPSPHKVCVITIFSARHFLLSVLFLAFLARVGMLFELLSRLFSGPRSKRKIEGDLSAIILGQR